MGNSGVADSAPDPYLGAVARLLWPEPAQLSWSHRYTRSPAGAVDYLILPSAMTPKLLVPRRPRRAAGGAVRNYKTTVNARERFTLGAVALAVRLGAADLVADRLRVEYRAGTARADIETHLSGVLGRPVRVSLYVGPARAVRKPVLQVIDNAGKTFAFAKLGIDDFTRQLVRAEADAVAFLSGVEWSVLQVPAVLHAGTWNGSELLVQTAFSSGSDAEPGSTELGRAMDELARVRGVERALLAQSTYWRRLQERVAGLPPSDLSALLARSLGDVERLGGRYSLEYGSWHGDWLPWNMVVLGGRVPVWDWEKFETGVPIGFDAVHYDVQRSVLTAATRVAQAFDDALARSSRLLSVHGVEPAPLVVWLYALDIAVRYLEDREMEAGPTRMSQLSAWLPHVLDTAARTMSVFATP